MILAHFRLNFIGYVIQTSKSLHRAQIDYPIVIGKQFRSASRNPAALTRCAIREKRENATSVRFARDISTHTRNNHNQVCAIGKRLVVNVTLHRFALVNGSKCAQSQENKEMESVSRD